MNAPWCSKTKLPGLAEAARGTWSHFIVDFLTHRCFQRCWQQQARIEDPTAASRREFVKYGLCIHSSCITACDMSHFKTVAMQNPQPDVVGTSLQQLWPVQSGAGPSIPFYVLLGSVQGIFYGITITMSHSCLFHCTVHCCVHGNRP